MKRMLFIIVAMAVTVTTNGQWQRSLVGIRTAFQAERSAIIAAQLVRALNTQYNVQRVNYISYPELHVQHTLLTTAPILRRDSISNVSWQAKRVGNAYKQTVMADPLPTTGSMQAATQQTPQTSAAETDDSMPIPVYVLFGMIAVAVVSLIVMLWGGNESAYTWMPSANTACMSASSSVEQPKTKVELANGGGIVFL